MAAGEVKAFGGFTLGSFAPRKGKVASCTPADGYKKAAAGSTLQDCFLECLVYGYMSHTIICDVCFFLFSYLFFIRILGFVLNLREHCLSSVAYATVSPPCSRSQCLPRKGVVCLPILIRVRGNSCNLCHTPCITQRCTVRKCLCRACFNRLDGKTTACAVHVVGCCGRPIFRVHSRHWNYRQKAGKRQTSCIINHAQIQP